MVFTGLELECQRNSLSRWCSLIIFFPLLLTFFVQASTLPKKIVCNANDIYTITITNAHLISSTSTANPGTISLKDLMGTIVNIQKNEGYTQYNKSKKIIEVGSENPEKLFHMQYSLKTRTGFFKVGSYETTIDKCNL